MHRAPIELEWEFSARGDTVEFRIVHQFKRADEFEEFLFRNFSITYGEWIGSNGWMLKSVAGPAIGTVDGQRCILYLRGASRNYDDDLIECSYTEFREILRVVYEFNHVVVSWKSSISLEDEFFQRVR